MKKSFPKYNNIKHIKMKSIYTLLIGFLLLSQTNTIMGQSVGINSDGSVPNSSAMLDVKSANKGLLIPNVALAGTTDATTITSPAVSLLVYNTTTVSNVTPGYYYNSGSGVSPVWTRLVTTLADGSETKVSAGTNVSVTGAGTNENPYVVNAVAANGSETKVTAGTNVTITGTGTAASPYVVNAAINYGDIKQGIQSADHNGWIKLDGRLKTALTAAQQAQATALGIGTNLPDATNSFPVQNGTTLGSVSGSNTVTIARNQLPDVTWTGNIYQVAHGCCTGGSADGVFSRTGAGGGGNATGGGSTNTYSLDIRLNGGVTQQTLNITPKSLSVNMFIYLGS